MSDLPEGWASVTINEVAKGSGQYGSGVAALPYDPDLPRYVRVTDIGPGGNLNSDTLASIRESDAAPYMLREGDLLFARSGSVGKAYLYEESDGPCAYAGYVIKFSIDQSIALPRYVRCWTQSTEYWRWVKGTFRQAAQPNINATEYGKHRFPLPPFGEQRRIAEILDALDARITAVDAEQTKAQAAMEALAQAVLPVNENPTIVGGEWRLLPMIDVVPSVEYGISSPLVASSKGTPTLRMNNLVDGGIKLHEVKVSTEPVPPNLLLREGDVLFNRTNSLEHVGRTSMWRAELPVATFASYLVRLIPDTSQLDSAYLVRWLNRPVIQQRIRRYATPGVHQVNINPTNLRRTLMELPRDLGHQREIVAVLDGAENLVSQLRNERRRLEVLKQGLAEDLLSGRVRV